MTGPPLALDSLWDTPPSGGSVPHASASLDSLWGTASPSPSGHLDSLWEASAHPVPAQDHPGNIDLRTPADLPHIPAVQADATYQGPPKANPHATKIGGPLGSILQYGVNPIMENPLSTMATMALPPLAVKAAYEGVQDIGGYLGQKAAEMTLPDKERTEAEADPNRIPGDRAAVEAGMLAAGPLIHAGVKAVRGMGSTPPPVDAPLEERNLGPLSTEAKQAMVQGGRELFTDPNAGLVAQGGPKADVAQHIAAANAAHQLPIYAKQQASAALEGLTDEQKQQFDARIVLDNLEAEATRKAESAPDVADRAAKAASAIRTQLPTEDISGAPWFQTALQNAKQRVLPVTEGMAPEAGVSPESFRKPSLGLYAPLLGNLDDEAPTAPTQPPLNRRPTTRTSGSANPFTGTAEQYAVGDYPARVAVDAQGKSVSAAKNRVLAGVANTGREIGDRTEADPETERVFAFNNKNEIVNVPSKGSEPGLRMFAVPNDVADAVDRYNARSGPPGKGMKTLQSVSTAATKGVLLNPLVAPFHALREAGSLGTVGSGNIVQDALMSVPFAKSTTVLAKAAALDPTDPAFIEADRKAVLAGAARVEESKGGLLSKGHEWLFGAPGKTERGIPTGMDRRIRALATMQFTEDRASKNLPTEGPAYDHALRSFVNSHVGDYVAKNRGEIVQAIKGIAPFAPMHVAGAVTGAKSLVGESGLSEPTTMQKVGTALRGPAGAIATTAAATKLLSGRSASENGRDRETAVGVPLYNVPGKTMPQFFYGSGEDAMKKFGPGTKAISLRDPGQSVVARIMSPLIYADRGDKAGEVGRQATNFGLSFAGPAVSGAATMAGLPTYFGANDKAPSDNTPTLSLTEKTTHRIGQALENATAAGALTGSGGRSLSQTLFPPLTEGSPNSKQADFQAKVYDFQGAVKSSLSRTSDKKEQQQIIKDAKSQLIAKGIPKDGVEAFDGQMQKFVDQRNDPSYRQGRAEKFKAMYGGAP